MSYTGHLVIQHPKYGAPSPYDHEYFLKLLDLIDETWEDYIVETEGNAVFCATVMRREDGSYFEIPLALLEHYLRTKLRPKAHAGDPSAIDELIMWDTFIMNAPPEDDYIAVEWW